MAQRLVVPVADHRGRNRLAVGHAAVAERGADAEPLPKAPAPESPSARAPCTGRAAVRRQVSRPARGLRSPGCAAPRAGRTAPRFPPSRRTSAPARSHRPPPRPCGPIPHARPRAVQPDGAAEHAGLGPLHLLVPAALGTGAVPVSSPPTLSRACTTPLSTLKKATRLPFRRARRGIPSRRRGRRCHNAFQSARPAPGAAGPLPRRAGPRPAGRETAGPRRPAAAPPQRGAASSGSPPR